MRKRVFTDWLGTFRESINGYDYYNDFEKAVKNAKKFECEIHILNCLVGAENIEEKFKKIVKKYPECLRAIPVIMAVRNYKIYCQDENGAFIYRFDKKVQTIKQYIYFMQKTGLFNMLQKRIISNLYDYVTGVEVGLDSNGRKNRGGHQMEKFVEKFLKESGVEYIPQMSSEEIEKKWNIDLSKISQELTSGKVIKKFDFVVKTKNNIYAIETNFYSSEGSKLNETARSYKMLAEESKNIKGFKFVWITDGCGWESAKTNLEETFNVLKDLYNIHDLENGIFKNLFK